MQNYPANIQRLINRQQKTNSSSPTTGDAVIAQVNKVNKQSYTYKPESLAGFGSEARRIKRIQECRDMNELDSRPRRLTSKFAKDATGGEIQVDVQGVGAKKAEDIALAMIERVKLVDLMRSFVYTALRDGDLFISPDINTTRQPQIVGLDIYDAVKMHRNSNFLDKFVDPRHAFWFGEWLSYTSLKKRMDVVWFPEFLMVHARYDHNMPDKYGFPMFGASRRSFEFTVDGESDAAIRRRTRAGMRYMHELEGATWEQIEQYRLENQDTLDSWDSPIQDFYTNRKGSIHAVQGDANLSQLGDIEHHQETFATGSEVPLAVVGYGKDINRDILKDKMTAYYESVQSLCDWSVDQAIVPLVEREWLLHGILPNSLKYKITMTRTRPVTAEEITEVARAIAGLKSLGLFPDNEMLIRLATKLIPIIDTQQSLDAYRDVYGDTEQQREIDRMLRIANQQAGDDNNNEEGFDYGRFDD